MTERKWQVGITGGMGAGKSLVAKIFSVLDIPIYSADERAKYLMLHDSGLRNSIIDLLGPESYQEDGMLNRGYIASQIFADSFKLEALNALVHPHVHRDAKSWHLEQTSCPYSLKEAAITFESGNYLELDFVINVQAPEALRIARIKTRDGLSEESIRSRLSRQWTESQRTALADFNVINDGTQSLIPQVMKIHNQLRNPDRD